MSTGDVVLVVSRHLWLFGDGDDPGRWDEKLTAVCTWCGAPFEVPEAWVGQEIRCPRPDCAKRLHLNPFVCDPSGDR